MLLSFWFYDRRNKERKQLQERAEKAIKQIVEQKYDFSLQENEIYIKLAHCGKEVEKWQEGTCIVQDVEAS